MPAPHLDSLASFLNHGRYLRVECGCGRRYTVLPLIFYDLFRARGLDTSLATIKGRLRCKRCGARPIKVELGGS